LACKTPPAIAKENLKIIYFNLADNYFTMLRYDEAYHYALKAKPLLVDELMIIDNTSILGYCLYLKKNYAESLKEYEFANALNKKHHTGCKASELLYKIAKINDKLGYHDKAVSIVDNAITMSDSCGQIVNSINGRLSKHDILRSNHKYREATELMDSIRKMENDFAFNERNQKMDALEAQYKDKLKTQENASLVLINKKNSKVISQQKIILLISVLTLLIFLALVFYLFKFSKKQKFTNLELEKQKTQIESNNKELVRFNILHQKIFSVISHDFKGPITTLKLLLSNKEIEKSENPMIAAYIKDVGLQLEQSDDVLESLLDWAKTELNINVTNTVEIKLKSLVNEIIKQSETKAKEKNITIRNDIAEEDVVVFSSEVLKIVLRNIINNALKFSNANGSIEIYCLENSIKVRDYGGGIPEKKITKLFHQVINPGLGTNQESGFGLGLYLSYELMQKYKGTISVENHELGGCTFSIVFP
ncbi:MAG: HAMP domain-containing sensor histidine kinase, partial [Bacteroidota bacterium]